MFWSLPGIEDILKNQWMDFEMPADLFKNVYLVDAIDINPGYRGFITVLENFFDGGNFPLLIAFCVVVKDSDSHLLSSFFPNVHKGTGWQSGLLGSF